MGKGQAKRADFERISKFFLLSDQSRIEGGGMCVCWTPWVLVAAIDDGPE